MAQPNDTTVQMNPLAILQALGERYVRLLNDGIPDPEPLRFLQNELNYWLTTWQNQVNDPSSIISGFSQQMQQSIFNQTQNMIGRMDAAISTEGLLAVNNIYDQQYGIGGSRVDKLTEWASIVKNKKLTGEQALKLGTDMGLPLEDVQHFAYNIDALSQVLADAGGFDPLTGIPVGDPGGGSFKPYEPIGDKPTPFLNDFGNAFATYTAEALATGKGSIAGGSDSILARNFQRLQTLYLGEIGRRSTLDPTDPLYEDPGVYDFVKVNIGKSTDPQFNQESDRFQDQRVEPRLKPLDFLRSIDIEDLAASTVPEDRPGRGRATPGWTGYVRRL